MPPPPAPDYVELRCRSAFSFLEAASNPEDLVARAADLGHGALALADRDGLSGAPRFFQAARGRGAAPDRGGRRHARAAGRARRAGFSAAAGRDRRGLPRICVVCSRSGTPAAARASPFCAGRSSRRGPRAWSRSPAATPRSRRRCSSARAPSSAAGASSSTCRVTWSAAPRRPRARPWRSPRRRASRSSRPATCASPRPRTGPCSTRSPACATRPRSTAPAAGSRATPSATCARPARWPRASRTGRTGCAPRARSPSAAPSAWRTSATAFPSSPCPPARPRRAGCGGSPCAARASATAPPLPPRARAQLEHELRVIEKLDLAGYFLIVHDIARFATRAEDPGAGARLGRQQRRLLRARDHRRRSRRHGAALRALPLGGARRVARHRPRPAFGRAARARDPVRVRQVRRTWRRHDGRRDHLAEPARRARDGQGAGPRRPTCSTASRS